MSTWSHITGCAFVKHTLRRRGHGLYFTVHVYVVELRAYLGDITACCVQQHVSKRFVELRRFKALSIASYFKRLFWLINLGRLTMQHRPASPDDNCPKPQPKQQERKVPQTQACRHMQRGFVLYQALWLVETRAPEVFHILVVIRVLTERGPQYDDDRKELKAWQLHHAPFCEVWTIMQTDCSLAQHSTFENLKTWIKNVKYLDVTWWGWSKWKINTQIIRSRNKSETG